MTDDYKIPESPQAYIPQTPNGPHRLSSDTMMPSRCRIPTYLCGCPKVEAHPGGSPFRAWIRVTLCGTGIPSTEPQLVFCLAAGGLRCVTETTEDGASPLSTGTPGEVRLCGKIGETNDSYGGFLVPRSPYSCLEILRRHERLG